MWLVRYTYPSEIIYNRGGGFLSLDFKNSLIEEEYGINTKPDYLGNMQANVIIETIHQLLVNVVRTYNLQGKYVDGAEPWIGILSASALVLNSTYQHVKGKIPEQLVFGRDIILPIMHIENWRYIHQRKQAQIYQ